MECGDQFLIHSTEQDFSQTTREPTNFSVKGR